MNLLDARATTETGSGYQVTEAGPELIEEVVALVNSAYRGETSRAGWTTEADLFAGERISPGRLLQELGSGAGRRLLVLRRRERDPIRACVLLERFEDERGAGCFLGMLTVRPDLQDGGIGRMLLAHAEEQARAWGASRMQLTVINQRATLMAWYERRGYRKTGKTRPFHYERAAKELPLRDDLAFVYFEKSLG